MAADIIYVDFRKREPVYHWTNVGYVKQMEDPRMAELRNDTWHHNCKKHGPIGMRKGKICQACGMHENSTTAEDFPGGAA